MQQCLDDQYGIKRMSDHSIGVRLVVSWVAIINEPGMCKLQLGYININYLFKFSNGSENRACLEYIGFIRTDQTELIVSRRPKRQRYISLCKVNTILGGQHFKMHLKCIRRHNNTTQSTLSCSQHIDQRLYQFWCLRQKIYRRYSDDYQLVCITFSMLFATLLYSATREVGNIVRYSLEAQEADKSNDISIPTPTPRVDIQHYG